MKNIFFFLVVLLTFSCSQDPETGELLTPSVATDVSMSRYEKAANHRGKFLTHARYDHTATALSD
jgi:hypothetical protein